MQIENDMETGVESWIMKFRVDIVDARNPACPQYIIGP